MARALYVAGSEADSGKSVIALGLLELLARRAGRLGVFRPVVQPGAPDVVLELLQRRDGRGAVEGEVGVDYDTVHADPHAALGLILARFRALAARTDAVLAVGTDFRDVGAPVELAFNARVAVNLAAPVVSVVSGRGRRAEEVLGAVDVALASLAESGAQVAAVVANRVVAEEVEEVRERLGAIGAPAYVVPEEPLLAAPTVGELVAACAGELVAATGRCWAARRASSSSAR
jgi:phosphate acetyltransferase